jgi:hypothetical protein
MVEATFQRRYRLSKRALMIGMALCAFLLAPVVLMFRQAEALRLEKAHAEHARAVALARFTEAGFSAPKLGNVVEPEAGNLWAALTVLCRSARMVRGSSPPAVQDHHSHREQHATGNATATG